jgi:peptidoglycan/xylan/chitin deacetylase (PgdA/CDA1 family)
MKIRYFCVTLLFCGLFVYGAVILLEKVVQRVSVPVLGSSSVTSEDTVAALVTDTAPPPVEVQEPDETNLPVSKDTVTQPVRAVTFMPDIEKVEEVQKQYAHTAPAQWGEHTRGVVHKVNLPPADSSARTLFLTINAYNSHQEELTAYLATNNIKATVFVSGYYVQQHTRELQHLAQNPLFDIENLGNRCRPVSVSGNSAYHLKGTANIDEALQEVTEGAKKIQQVTGKYPVYFRSATGYIDDVATKAINELGIRVIGYDRVTDGGGVINAIEIKQNILKAHHGAILVISINLNYPNIFEGLQAAIEEIKAQKLPVRFEKLSDYQAFFEANR